MFLSGWLLLGAGFCNDHAACATREKSGALGPGAVPLAAPVFRSSGIRKNLSGELFSPVKGFES